MFLIDAIPNVEKKLKTYCKFYATATKTLFRRNEKLFL